MKNAEEWHGPRKTADSVISRCPVEDWEIFPSKHHFFLMIPLDERLEVGFEGTLDRRAVGSPLHGNLLFNPLHPQSHW
jgi:hypothetical protein